MVVHILKGFFKHLKTSRNKMKILLVLLENTLRLAGTPEANTTASMRGTNNVVHQVSGSPVVHCDEFDTSVAMFNIAVVWFHLHEYPKSFSCLDTLYQNSEPIDEGTALRICLLLLDVALGSQHASRSAASTIHLRIDVVFSSGGYYTCFCLNMINIMIPLVAIVLSQGIDGIIFFLLEKHWV